MDLLLAFKVSSFVGFLAETGSVFFFFFYLSSFYFDFDEDFI